MANLRLLYDAICAELFGMAELAGDFLQVGSMNPVAKAAYDLKEIHKRKGGVWRIREDSPIKTKPTISYQPNDEGGIAVIGMLSFIWDVQIQGKYLLLAGKTSTVITIVPATDEKSPVLCWKTEMGDSNSPGCHFHIHIPRTIQGRAFDVPRLPSILLTPTDCLDFMLGELFQERWVRHQESQAIANANWRTETRSRIATLLRKQAERVAAPAELTPWIHLKQWHLREPLLEH